jgi:hypothetical protein
MLAIDDYARRCPVSRLICNLLERANEVKSDDFRLWVTNVGCVRWMLAAHSVGAIGFEPSALTRSTQLPRRQHNGIAGINDIRNKNGTFRIYRGWQLMLAGGKRHPAPAGSLQQAKRSTLIP